MHIHTNTTGGSRYQPGGHMANSTTSANNVQTTSNKTMINNTISEAMLNITTSVVKSTIVEALTASALFNKEIKKVVRVEKTRIKGSKGGKAKNGTRVKRTPIYATTTVLDVAELNRVAKLVKAHNIQAAKDAVKAAKLARQAERVESLQFQAAMKAEAAKLAYVQDQLDKARAITVRPIHTKEALMTIKTGSQTAGQIRNAARVARGVAQAQYNCAIPLSCSLPKAAVVKTVDMRAEGRKLLAALRTKTKTPKTKITMVNTINLLASVFTTITDALRARRFTQEAAARMEATRQSLPGIAQYMTMNATLDFDTIMLEIHNDAMDALSCGATTDYMDAVLDTYESTCERLNVAVTESIEDAVFQMASNQPSTESATTGGGDNLNKNSEEVNTNTITGNTMTNNQAPDFNTVFPANTLGLNSEQGTVAAAKVIAGVMFKLGEEPTEEKAKGAYNLKLKQYQKALEATNNFIEKWESKLGFVKDGVVITIAANNKINNCPTAVREFCKLFGYVGVTPKGEPTDNVKLFGTVVPAASAASTPTKISASEMFFSFVAGATSHLTAEEFVELLVDLNPKVVKMNKLARQSATVVDLGHVQINFANLSITRGSQVHYMNKGSIFMKEGVDTLALHTLFLFALTICGESKAAINTLVSHASNLFKRQESYGAKADADDIRYHVDNNLVLCAKTAPKAKGAPYFYIKTAKHNPEALTHVMNKGIFAAVDKTNVKWLTTEAGAHAMGLGWDRETDTVLNISDASKPNKVYNRPASLKYSFATQAAREASNFCFKVGDEGQRAFVKGRALRAIYTNSRFCPGSGVALTNPNLIFNYEVNTTLSEPVNILTFPAELRAGKSMEEYRKSIIAMISDQVEGIQGKVFAPGEEIIRVDLAGESRVLMNNSKKAVTVRVDSTTVVESDFNEDVIDVKARVSIVGADRYLKLRTAFYKATTLPYAVDVAAINNSDWDIILNNETVKGQNALTVMWANEQEGVVEVDMNKGVAVCADGRVIDLTVLDNEIAEWRKANVQTTTLTFDVARSVFEDIRHQFENRSDVRIVSKSATVVTVEETVEYIAGKLHFDIEIATPRECVGTSSLTFEQQSAILLQDRVLGEQIINGLAGKIKDMQSLVAAYAGGTADKPSFTISNEAGRDAFANAAFGGTSKFVKYIANHRSILKVLDKKFPQGFTLNCENIGDIHIHPKALLAFGQFASNGSSAREVAKVIDFIFAVMTLDFSDSKTAVSQAKAASSEASKAIAKWSANLVNSSKAMKKVTRTGDVVCGKVRTSFATFLHSTDGIPMIGLNPDCPMVRLLRAAEGDLVAINRTPMPFITIARVVFDESIDPAHAVLSPLWWHLANEGDSDGDGIGIMNVASMGMTVKRAHKINNALMGPAGYLYIYAGLNSVEEYFNLPSAERPELPFDEFMSFADKQGKKAITFNGKNSLPVITTSIKGQTFDVEAYCGYAKAVAMHYKAAVGTSYGVCSQLVFAAAERLYITSEPEMYQRTLRACVIAWRLIYEGLGLAGWSENADTFFKYFKAAADDYSVGRVKDNEGRIISFYARAGVELNALPILLECLEEAGAHAPSAELMRDILRSMAVVKTYQQMERSGKPSKCRAHLRTAAVIAGTLRRIGQGVDPTELEDPNMPAEEDSPVSMTGAFHAANLGATGEEAILFNSRLAMVAGAAAAAHTTLRGIFADKEFNPMA